MRFFDTTFVLDSLSADRPVVERARAPQESQELSATAAPCIPEVIRGAKRAEEPGGAAAKALIGPLEVVPLTTESAYRAVPLAAAAQDRGGEVQLIDCWIAGVLTESVGILLSRDTDFSRIPGLLFESY
ncbi:MAG TPA: PIN domain-containing protein [Thermoplasmata archaeon]|nr:PIN domain-containing protein [Thermoplasmata archaeon]